MLTTHMIIREAQRLVAMTAYNFRKPWWFAPYPGDRRATFDADMALFGMYFAQGIIEIAMRSTMRVWSLQNATAH